MKLLDAEKLLGQQVVVTLDRDGESRSVACGQLLHFADSGEVTVLDEMGFVHHCWPMLNVEAAG